MGIKYGGILPHSPALSPQIISNHTQEKMKSTISAYNKIAFELYSKNIETIVYITSHPAIQKDCFTLVHQESIITDFQRFGDFKSTSAWNIDLELTSQIIEKTKTSSCIRSIHIKPAHSIISLPLLLLTQKLPNIKVVVIGSSLLDTEAHYNFGLQIREVLENSNKNIAILTSIELSEKTEEKNQDIKNTIIAYDDAVMSCMRDNNLNDLLHISPLATQLPQALRSYYSLIIIAGIYNEISYTIDVLSYEAPFGIGYLTCQINS